MTAAGTNESEATHLLRELRRMTPAIGLKQLLGSGTGSDPAQRDVLESKLLAVIEESGRLTMISVVEALEATAFVVELADESGLDLARARARRARARALAYAGRFDEALFACSEAITIASHCGRPEEAARARLASMHALVETGRLDEAIDAGLAAREAFEAANQPALGARADNNLGIVFQRRDQPAAALECFERARPLLSDDSVALGHLENSRGEALLALNDFAGAEGAFTSALAAFEDAGADLTAAIAEGNLADLATRRGRFREAMHYFERARRRLERTDSPGHLARLIAEQAEAKALMGLLSEAIAEYEDALSRLESSGMPLEQARARAALGLALFRAGRFAQAETALSAAAAAFEQLNLATARARVDLIRAELAARNGDIARLRDARAIALRALAALEARPLDAAAARHLLGRLSLAMNDHHLAECDLKAAVSMAEQLGIAPMQSDVHHSLGRCYLALGRRDEAIENLSLAVQFSERIRATIQAERFRTAFLGNRAALYEELVASLIECGDDGSIERAFETAERCKSRALLDRIAADAQSPPEAAAAGSEPIESDDCEMTARMRGLREELSALYSRLGDEPFASSAASATGTNDLRAWRNRVHDLERELNDIESRLESARGMAALHAPSVAFTDVHAALREDEALIEYFSVGDEFLAFVVRRDRPPVAHQLVGATASLVEQHLDRLHFQIDRALRRLTTESPAGAVHNRLVVDAQRELGMLYAHLMQEVEAGLDGISRLMIVPHGPLHALPFHALWDARSGEYLDDRHIVCTAPSASVLVRPARSAVNAKPAAAGPLVVAAADETVPHIVDEGREVASALGAPLLADEGATIAAVREAAPQHSILHFACHGRFDPASPHASGLRLADGWLTLRDICDLHLASELVFLSACETGLSRVESGDEVLGLQRAFLAAGACTLLQTLWRVPDKTTVDFARFFYSAWHTDDGRVDAAEAARCARKALREKRPRNAHPAVWAPFAVTGGEN